MLKSKSKLPRAAIPPPPPAAKRVKLDHPNKEASPHKAPEADAHAIRVQQLIATVEKTASSAQQADPLPGGLAQWRAMILTVHDRWGIGKASKSLKKVTSAGIDMDTVVRAVKSELKRLRTKLASRDDTQRVQAQRIIHGPSLLCLTRSRSPQHNAALNALLATIIHPSLGMPSHNVKNLDDIPFLLPKHLQPALPELPNRTVEAVAINKLMASVYTCIETGAAPKEISDFVHRHQLTTDAGRVRFGNLPPRWTPQLKFESVMPHVPQGSVIMWRTWHATGGSKPGHGAKLVAFLDMVPRHFLSNAEYTWYEYCTRNAPVDPGAGSSRGAWQSMVHLIRSHHTEGFGTNTKGWAKVGDPSTLTGPQKSHLASQGYLIVSPPTSLQHHAPATRSAQNFQVFFNNISGYPLDIAKTQGVGSITHLFEEEGKAGGSMRNRLQSVLPEKPFSPEGGKRSGTAQGGGAFITKSAGMGSGTTYCNEPQHVRFQTSQWVANIMTAAGGDFYHGELIPVWERFRLKDQAKWAKYTHVDTRIDNLIPPAVRHHPPPTAAS